jgi:hypothetical protein
MKNLNSYYIREQIVFDEKLRFFFSMVPQIIIFATIPPFKFIFHNTPLMEQFMTRYRKKRWLHCHFLYLGLDRFCSTGPTRPAQHIRWQSGGSNRVSRFNESGFIWAKWVGFGLYFLAQRCP